MPLRYGSIGEREDIITRIYCELHQFAYAQAVGALMRFARFEMFYFYLCLDTTQNLLPGSPLFFATGLGRLPIFIWVGIWIFNRAFDSGQAAWQRSFCKYLRQSHHNGILPLIYISKMGLMGFHLTEELTLVPG